MHHYYGDPYGNFYTTPYYDIDGNYTDGFYRGIISGVVAGAISIVLFLIVILLAYTIVSYIFTSLSYYQMAKSRSLKYPGLAWIPIGRHYLTGALIGDQVTLSSKQLPYASIFLPVAATLFITLTGLLNAYMPLGIKMLLFIAIVLLAIYRYAAYYALFKLYRPNYAVVFLVLTILFMELPLPFFLFSMRKKEVNQEAIHYGPTAPANPRGILSVILGALGLLLLVVGLGAFWPSVCAIILGILAVKENRQLKENTILPVLGIVLGAVCIIFGMYSGLVGIISLLPGYGGFYGSGALPYV